MNKISRAASAAVPAMPTRTAARRRSGNELYAAWRLGVLILVAGIVLVPLLSTVLGGFKDLGELRASPLGLPRVWRWGNYSEILTSFRYWRVLGNSLLIASFTVALTVALSAMAAFAFAHLRFFGRQFLFGYLVLGLMFPSAAAILPLFIKVRDLGLVDTPWGVILPQVAFGLAMGVLLMRNAFRQLPHELLEAALVDGCGGLSGISCAGGRLHMIRPLPW